MYDIQQHAWLCDGLSLRHCQEPLSPSSAMHCTAEPIAGPTPVLSIAVCLPGYGGTICSACAVGTFSAGTSASDPNLPCTSCTVNMTTLSEASNSSTACSGERDHAVLLLGCRHVFPGSSTNPFHALLEHALFMGPYLAVAAFELRLPLVPHPISQRVSCLYQVATYTCV